MRLSQIVIGRTYKINPRATKEQIRASRWGSRDFEQTFGKNATFMAKEIAEDHVYGDLHNANINALSGPIYIQTDCFFNPELLLPLNPCRCWR